MVLLSSDVVLLFVVILVLVFGVGCFGVLYVLCYVMLGMMLILLVCNVFIELCYVMLLIYLKCNLLICEIVVRNDGIILIILLFLWNLNGCYFELVWVCMMGCVVIYVFFFVVNCGVLIVWLGVGINLIIMLIRMVWFFWFIMFMFYFFVIGWVIIGLVCYLSGGGVDLFLCWSFYCLWCVVVGLVLIGVMNVGVVEKWVCYYRLCVMEV